MSWNNWITHLEFGVTAVQAVIDSSDITKSRLETSALIHTRNHMIITHAL